MRHEKWLKRESNRLEKEVLSLFRMKKINEDIDRARKINLAMGHTSFSYYVYS